MRVLHAVRPAAGGMKEHVLELCRGLRDRGHVVEIACPFGSEIAREAAALGLVVRAVVLVGPLAPISDVRGIVQIAGIVRRGHFDIVHAHGFKAGLVGRLGALFGGCHTRVVTIHGHVAYSGDGVSRFTKSVYRIAERALSAITTQIIAVSDALRRELVDEYGIAPERVVTVHNGVDVAAFLEKHDVARERARLDVPAESLVVGTAARFAPQKGLRYFAEAAAETAEDRRDVVFILGGDGPLGPDLGAILRALGAESVVRMPGFIKDMPAFLSALDIFVSSSLTEGLPLTLVQAGAAACPVVATDVGGTPEVVRDGASGLLVPPADAHALAGAFSRLLDDPDLRERLGAEGRRIALSEFAPEAMITRTLEVYADAMSRS